MRALQIPFIFLRGFFGCARDKDVSRVSPFQGCKFWLIRKKLSGATLTFTLIATDRL
jgi:hypothetical protein